MTFFHWYTHASSNIVHNRKKCFLAINITDTLCVQDERVLANNRRLRGVDRFDASRRRPDATIVTSLINHSFTQYFSTEQSCFFRSLTYIVYIKFIFISCFYINSNQSKLFFIVFFNRKIYWYKILSITFNEIL